MFSKDMKYPNKLLKVGCSNVIKRDRKAWRGGACLRAQGMGRVRQEDYLVASQGNTEKHHLQEAKSWAGEMAQ